jgi:hypothetical protein
MNRDRIFKMAGTQVRTRPMAKRVKQTGEDLPPIDYVWRIESTSKDEIALFNGSTGHLLRIGTDHIREYLTDRTDGLDGFLVLKSQIILKGPNVYVEPMFGNGQFEPR